MDLPEIQDRLTLEQVAVMTGRSTKSIRRWVRTGVVVNGRRVRLASLKVGATRVTSRTWLASFLAAQNPAGLDVESPIRTPAEQARRADKARAELAAILGT